jgi:hypothetical protein
MTQPERIFAWLDAPAARPNRACSRCEAMAQRARDLSLPVPLVNEVETWVQLSLRYFGALCAECADWEWSANWNARYARAASDPVERQRLEQARDERVSRGRRFWRDARLEVAARR